MSIAYSEMANTVWDNLKKRYGMPKTPKIHQLKANYIANCKQGDLSVGEFYSSFKNLWTELTNLVKVPICTCSGSKCRVVGKIMAMYEEDKAHQFIMGLNDDSYAIVRTQILALDSLPPLDKIFNMTQQEEAHKQVMVA